VSPPNTTAAKQQFETTLKQVNMKHKILSTAFALFCLLLTSFGQTGVKVSNTTERSSLVNMPFPELKARTLAGSTIIFPAGTKDKATIICVAFKDEAQPLADTWTKDIMANYSDSLINYFEVPMLKNGLKLMRGMIDGGMRKSIDKNLHDNVATYYGGLESYKKALLMPDDMSCYIFLIDKEGIIQFTTEGSADAEKLQQLYTRLKSISK
jgi:hypothetical protein